MNDQTRPRTAADVLRDLHSFIADTPLDIDSLSDDQIRSELKRRRIDSTPSFRAIHDLLDDHIASEELALARKSRMKKLEARRSSLSLVEGVRDKIQSLIKNLNPQLAGVYWSKYQTSEEEDLQSLYEDLEALTEETNSPDGNVSP